MGHINLIISTIISLKSCRLLSQNLKQLVNNKCGQVTSVAKLIISAKCSYDNYLGVKTNFSCLIMNMVGIFNEIHL